MPRLSSPRWTLNSYPDCWAQGPGPGLIIKPIWQFLFCLDNRKLYINPQIRPKFYKILENFDFNFQFFFGFPDIFRPRNINLRVEIFNLVPSMLNFVHFSAISWPSTFPSCPREPPSGTYGLYAPQQKRNCHIHVRIWRHTCAHI